MVGAASERSMRCTSLRMHERPGIPVHPARSKAQVMMRADHGRLMCGCQARSEHLTRREVEILLMTALGMSSQRIGVCLHISHRTVEQHIAIMLHRVNASNRCELVARCLVAGIITRDRW